MVDSVLSAANRARWVYVVLILWQAIWFAILPVPWGKSSPGLALVVTVPLLLPLYGVWKQQPRALIWAGYLMLLYLTLGLVEWWAAPAQRWPAAVHVLLSVGFLLQLAIVTRKQR